MNINQSTRGAVTRRATAGPVSPGAQSQVEGSFAAHVKHVVARPRDSPVAFVANRDASSFDEWDPSAVSYFSAMTNPAGDRLSSFCVGQNVLAAHNKSIRADVQFEVYRNRQHARHSQGCCTLL